MKWFLTAAAALVLLSGCESGPTEPTTPTEMFTSESKPYGDPGLDPYRPEGPKPLIEIPAGPKPAPPKPQPQPK